MDHVVNQKVLYYKNGSHPSKNTDNWYVEHTYTYIHT